MSPDTSKICNFPWSDWVMFLQISVEASYSGVLHSSLIKTKLSKTPLWYSSCLPDASGNW